MGKRELSAISYHHELSFYTAKKNIANQKLVEETIDWFEHGPGKRVYTSLEFLNLLWKQYHFIIANIEDTGELVAHFQELPLTDLEKHVLSGLIIKWFGGYPLEMPLEVDKNQFYYDFRKALLELFLNYPGDTPEKEFCKVDWEDRKKLEKLSIAFNTSLNTNIPVADLIKAMDEGQTRKVTYKSFDELFTAAYDTLLMARVADPTAYVNMQSLYNFKFNVWLQEFKEWQYGNNEQYRDFLSLEIFNEFLRDDKQKYDGITFLNGISGVQAFELFMERHNALRNTFRIKRKATKSDCDQISRLKVGDILSFEPDYKTTREAYVLLTEYYSKIYLELEKYNFLSIYKVSNEETLKAEIGQLEKFILAAKSTNLSEACNAFGKWGQDKNDFVYRRLESGYYENLEIEKYPLISCIGNMEAVIYGKYFLFYEYLKNSLKEITPIKQELIEFMETEINVAEEDIAKGFHKLEEYINKNVYEDTHINLARSKQLKRNLFSWKNQLQNNFIDPENKTVINSSFFNAWKKNAGRMQAKINSALEIIELRIADKEESSKDQNLTSSPIAAKDMQRIILRKGRKD